MSRRNGDFDEYCDPDNPRTIKHNEVIDAAERIRPYIVKTPCTMALHQREFGMNLYYKLEILQKTGCFKERGSVNVLELLPPDKKKLGVVVASLGNDAVGICYHASRLNIPTVVVMPTFIGLIKIQQCYSLGAKVVLQGNNLMECQRYARAIARDRGLTYINGRDHPHILTGYGSLALEIIEQVPNVDAILVSVGSGGLIAAIATVIKHFKPSCLVYGVQPESMPGFFKSLEENTLLTTPIDSTLADAISVPNIGVNAFHNAQPLIDKMLLVNEDWISRSMLYLTEKEKYVVEAAGACTLAAIVGNLVPEFKLKNVVCILSGGNAGTIAFTRSLDRGLSVEGRLIKFKVGIKDNPIEKTQLLKILAAGGFNIVHQFHDRVWVENDVYTIEIRLVCESRNMEHGLELKRIIERTYPGMSIFESEPFNDTRTCPCYVRKPM